MARVWGLNCNAGGSGFNIQHSHFYQVFASEVSAQRAFTITTILFDRSRLHSRIRSLGVSDGEACKPPSESTKRIKPNFGLKTSLLLLSQVIKKYIKNIHSWSLYRYFDPIQELYCTSCLYTQYSLRWDWFSYILQSWDVYHTHLRQMIGLFLQIIIPNTVPINNTLSYEFKEGRIQVGEMKFVNSMIEKKAGYNQKRYCERRGGKTMLNGTVT